MSRPGDLFQYQGRADPIIVPPVSGVMWAFQDPAPAHRDLRRSAALMAAVVTLVFPVEAVSPASWASTDAQQPRRPMQRQSGGAEPVPVVFPDLAWGPVPSAPPRGRAALRQGGGALFVPGRPEPIAWIYEPQRPRLNPPKPQSPSFFAPENPVVAQSFGWFRHDTQQPRRRHGTQNFPTLFAPLVVELPTLAWMQEPQTPLRRPSRKVPWETTWCPFSPAKDTPGSIAAWGYSPQQPGRRPSVAPFPTVFFVQALEFSDAWRPLVELPRPRSRLVNAQWCFLPESFNVSQVSWLQPLSIPRLRPRRPIDWGFQTDFFPVPTPVTITPSPTIINPATVPATRNRRSLTLPDIGTLKLRTDRLTGASEARIKAPAGMTSSYDLTLPKSLPNPQHFMGVDRDGNIVFMGNALVDVTALPFGAKGNNSANDTKAIQDAIAAVIEFGGGTVFLPTGTYLHTGLALDANVSLLGASRGGTILKLTSTTADSLTLPANPDNCSISNLTISASTPTDGWGITAPTATPRELSISKVSILNHLKGIYVLGGLDVSIDHVRINGRGKTLAGGIGIQIGTAVNGGNGINISRSYISTSEIGIVTHAQACMIDRLISEACTTGLQTWAGNTTVIMPWVGGTNTTDLDIQGNGVCLIGYGSSNWSINYIDQSARGRSVIIPDRMDFAEGAAHRGAKIGDFHVFDTGEFGNVQRQYFYGSRVGYASTVLSGLSGATATATNLIPGGVLVLGVSAYVTTTITGPTSYSIGDGTTPALFVNSTGRFTAGDTLDGGYVSNTFKPTWFNNPNNVVLTANGGNFTAGAIRLVIHYMTIKPPES